MFRIALNKIYLTRGDTARFSIELMNSPETLQDYVLSDKDEIYFIVTKVPCIIGIDDIDTNALCLFYKKGVNIVLNPEDTENLEEGIYYYQVRVILHTSGDLNTIIEPEEFHITPVRGW